MKTARIFLPILLLTGCCKSIPSTDIIKPEITIEVSDAINSKTYSSKDTSKFQIPFETNEGIVSINIKCHDKGGIRQLDYNMNSGILERYHTEKFLVDESKDPLHKTLTYHGSDKCIEQIINMPIMIKPMNENGVVEFSVTAEDFGGNSKNINKEETPTIKIHF
ncbi:hypothetical protein V6R21_25715 [Limibacter armeniacum]|uniref:hypothetical protein n=1 Tax=Limibacter armeniacum TaxID=466084 RepID=UPI002FE5B041